MTPDTKERLRAARQQLHLAQGHLTFAAKALQEAGLSFHATIQQIKENIGDLAVTQEHLSDYIDTQ